MIRYFIIFAAIFITFIVLLVVGITKANENNNVAGAEFILGLIGIPFTIILFFMFIPDE